MTKKDRERFSIKFNEKDPSHLAVIDILEQQGSRRKAQFIVNAVLHYIHCKETPDITATPPVVQPVDKAYIESVIREIMFRQQTEAVQEPEENHSEPAGQGSVTEYVKSVNDSEPEIADEATRALISATLSAFRNY